MFLKENLENFLKIEDLLHIEIFMKNGQNYGIKSPNEEGNLNIKIFDEYLEVYGDFDDSNRLTSIVPFENISHINAIFGEEGD